MIADALKKALLQAAIQGKLTEQLPEDGDARDLLKEIQKEKARLIKEGKIKKIKPFPEITEDEIPFDIPKNWVWIRLGDANVITMGQSPDGSSVGKNAGVEFHQGKIFFTDKYISDSQLRCNKPTKIAQAGSILLCVRAPVGVVNVTSREICIGRGLTAINPFSAIDREYLYYYLLTLKTYFVEKSTGSTFKAISQNTIGNAPLPIPPVEEQRRIVGKLENLLPEIETLQVEENKLDNLEKAFPGKIRASILQAAIQGKLTEQLPEDGDARDLLKEIQKEKARLIKEGKIKKQKPLPAITEDEIPFDIPENWAWCRLGTLVSIKTGSKDANWGSPAGTYRFFTCAKETILSETFSFEGKSIVMPGNGANVGESWLIDEKFEAYQRTYVLQGTSDDVYLEYVRTVLSSDWKKRYSGGVYGSAIPYIRLGELTDYIFPLPPLLEQKRIVKKLDELLPLCTSLETTSS